MRHLKLRCSAKLGEYTRAEFEKLINNGNLILDPNKPTSEQLDQFIDNVRLNTGCVGVTHIALRSAEDVRRYLNIQLGARGFNEFKKNPDANVIQQKMENYIYPQALNNVKDNGPWLSFDDAKTLKGVNPPIGPNDKYIIFAFIGDWTDGEGKIPKADEKTGKVAPDSVVYKTPMGKIAPWDYARANAPQFIILAICGELARTRVPTDVIRLLHIPNRGEQSWQFLPRSPQPSSRSVITFGN